MLLEEELRLKTRNKGFEDMAFSASTKGEGKSASIQAKKKPQKRKLQEPASIVKNAEEASG